MTAILVEKNSHPISEFWVVLSVDANGNEGICAGRGPDGWMPLVVAEERLLPGIMQMARDTARGTRGMRRIKLVKFTSRVDLQDVEP